MTDPLLEAAAIVSHAAYRFERADRKLHVPEECPCRSGHDFNAGPYCAQCGATGAEAETLQPCHSCRPALRPWDDLTEAARESFRDQALPAVEAVLVALVAAERKHDAELAALRAVRDTARELLVCVCGSAPLTWAMTVDQEAARAHEARVMPIVKALFDALASVPGAGETRRRGVTDA